MAAKTWIIIIIIITLALMGAAGFRPVWSSQPGLSETPEPIKATIANPNPPQPVTTCTSYGVRQENLKFEYTFKKVCHTVYQ